MTDLRPTHDQAGPDIDLTRPTGPRPAPPRHLLSVSDLGAEGIADLLRLTDSFVEVSRRPIPKVPALRGKTVVSVFFEDSTRTRLSFETAARRLSADVMTFSASSSSINKGESLKDTIHTIQAMGVDALVVRHSGSGVPWQVAGWVDGPSVVNAGDGWHEHPTQALLDCYTITRTFADRTTDRAAAGTAPLAGRRIAIVGDIRHSRVARSDVLAFTALGAEVVLAAPPTLLPPSLAGWPVSVSHDLDRLLPTLDVVYLLRLQRERMLEALLPSLREYTATYGLTRRRAALLKEDALIMHPGPVNRGVEIAAESWLDQPGSRVITAQVSSRVAVRMARSCTCSSDRGWILPPHNRPPATLVVRGGRIVDAGRTRQADLLIQDGIITSVTATVSSVPPGTVVLDASGCLVGPGLVDLHAHLREPGREEAETIETGSRAAALGGYTAVVAMPNTEPAMDSAAVIRQVQDLGADALCDVFPAGAITMGREGKLLAPMAEMAALGVRLFTDDGNGVQDSRLMRRAMEYATALGVTLAQHCEDASLAAGGNMHEGEWSSRLGLAGQPAEAEELMVMRDLALARLTGARLHFLHLSTAGSLAMVRGAKKSGLVVTAEVAPHHFTLTDECVSTYDSVFKVNPPLRTPGDVAAVKAALADGTADAIATDHAPHTGEAKEAPFDQAPPGMLGLETALALGLTELDVPVERVLALMSWQPAAIAGLTAEHGGPIEEGRPANLCVVDPAEEWTVDPAASASRSRNNPYRGRRLRGRVRHTVLHGEPVVIDGQAQR